MTLATSSINDILAAAEALFSEHGYAAVSMAQVAQASGISKSNIYHHFSSKDDLYTSVLRHACQDTLKQVQQLSASQGDSIEQLRHFSIHHFQHLHQKSRITKLILRELLDGGHEHSRLLAQQVFHEVSLQLKSLIQKGQEQHYIRNDMDAHHIAASMVALNIFLFQSWPILEHLPNSTFTENTNSQSMLFDILLNGFARPNTPH